MSNRFNGGRGAITCDNPEHDGRMICAGVSFSNEPPYLPTRQPSTVYYPDAVWVFADDGTIRHHCSAQCAMSSRGVTPLFPADMPSAADEMPRIYSADIGDDGKVKITGAKS
jgi:hypothetical protein